jgi:carbon monoxide dehydrogenase subunit G
MPTIRTVTAVDASPDRAWAVLGDLGAVETWIPGVTSCRLEGTRRICNEGDIEEEIVSYNPEERSYRYRQVKVPLPVRRSAGRLAVVQTADGTMIEWEAAIEWADPAQAPALTAMLEGVNRQVLESLRRRIEEGA